MPMLALNEIHHGDCLDLMRHIPDGSIDLILCDLPYGTTACHWDSVIPFDKLWAAYERIIKPNGAIVLTASQPFTSALVMSNPKLFKYEWIWEKDQGTNFAHCNYQPLKAHESVLLFSKMPAAQNSANRNMAYNPQGLIPADIVKSNHLKGSDGLTENSFSRTESYTRRFSNYPKSVLKYNKQRGLHPTQKPVALFEYLIRTYTNPGEVVLDNCAGSCTTAIAAINTGRQYLCIEQEAKYVAIGRQRVAALSPMLFPA